MQASKHCTLLPVCLVTSCQRSLRKGRSEGWPSASNVMRVSIAGKLRCIGAAGIQGGILAAQRTGAGGGAGELAGADAPSMHKACHDGECSAHVLGHVVAL